MNLKPKDPKIWFHGDEGLYWDLLNRVVTTLRDQAQDCDEDTLVSISEAIHNEIWSERLKRLAQQIEQEMKKIGG